MQQTNYQLFDFMGFDKAMLGDEVLWKACTPVSVQSDINDVVFEIPFQKQKVTNDIEPDFDEPRVNYALRIRAYGPKILRVAMGFDSESMGDSEMLAIDEDLEVEPLTIKVTEDEYLILDTSNIVRAKLNLQPHRIKFWSNLVPAPQESLELSFYPDGKKEIKLSAYDHFFPSRQDAYALAGVQEKGKFSRTTLSFAVEPNEKFVGSGERFAKLDLTGHTFQLINQDGQGVNNRRTYKNVPFLLSSRMYGTFLHTSAYSKMSIADHSTRSLQFIVGEPSIDVFYVGGGMNPKKF